MEKTLHVKTFIYFNRSAQQQLADFVNQNGIRKEDIVVINSSGNLEIIYYYA